MKTDFTTRAFALAGSSSGTRAVAQPNRLLQRTVVTGERRRGLLVRRDLNHGPGGRHSGCAPILHLKLRSGLSGVSAQGYKRIVKGRSTVLMLSAALVLSSVGSPCVGQQLSCAMQSVERMDCCNAKPGISAPSCCSGKQEVNKVIALPRDRLAKYAPAASAAHVFPVVASFGDPTRVFALQRIDARAAPPGGTLIAQHTSLLL